MIELRFHRHLYKGTAVDAAAKVYAGHAELELVQEERYWVVRVSAADPERERVLAGELGNYALGVTIDERGGLR